MPYTSDSLSLGGVQGAALFKAPLRHGEAEVSTENKPTRPSACTYGDDGSGHGTQLQTKKIDYENAPPASVSCIDCLPQEKTCSAVP